MHIPFSREDLARLADKGDPELLEDDVIYYRDVFHLPQYNVFVLHFVVTLYQHFLKNMDIIAPLPHKRSAQTSGVICANLSFLGTILHLNGLMKLTSEGQISLCSCTPREINLLDKPIIKLRNRIDILSCDGIRRWKEVKCR